MSQAFTPEINAILDQLAGICVQTMRDAEQLDRERCQQLAGSLSTNGWQRHSASSEPLSVIVTNRAKDQDSDVTMHHHKRLEALASEVGRICDKALLGLIPKTEKPLSDRNDLQAQSPRTGVSD